VSVNELTAAWKTHRRQSDDCRPFCVELSPIVRYSITQALVGILPSGAVADRSPITHK